MNCYWINVRMRAARQSIPEKPYPNPRVFHMPDDELDTVGTPNSADVHSKQSAWLCYFEFTRQIVTRIF